MKKLFFIFCLIIFPALAQEISNDTFSENNPNLIRDNEPRTFNGGSLVYIQGISDKPQPKTWMDNMKVRLFGSMEIPDRPSAPQLTAESSFEDPSKIETGIPTKDFFGASKELKYLPHTSDWNFVIQPMDSQNVSVQENIQFLLTEDTPILRSWPIKREQFILIKALIDGHPIDLGKDERIPLLNFGVLTAGLHKIEMHYTILISAINDLIMPLISNSWPLITDNFSGVILNGKRTFSEPHFLLGENLQEVPQNFIFQSDNQENIFFKNTHILPASTQIRLSVKSSDKAPQQDEGAPFVVSEFFFFIATFIVISLYLILSGCEICFASLAFLLKRFKHITQSVFFRWVYRMGEVCAGSLALLILAFLLTLLFSVPLSYNYWILLGILVILGIICLDIFIFYPKQKMVYLLHQKQGEK